MTSSLSYSPSTPPSSAARRFAFVMDQQVGLRTQFLNWKRVLAEMPDIDSVLVPVEYITDTGPITRLPVLPESVRGTIRGVSEIRNGLAGGDSAPLDAVLWATWAAKSVPDLFAAAPAYLVMDMTPVQMEVMGALYGYRQARARFFGGMKRRATERIYRYTRHFFPWSQFVADSLRDDYGIPESKITVVSPGTDIDLYHPDASATASDANARPVRLLFVGGDFARKGGDLLLRYLRDRRAQVNRGNPVELHVVTRDASLDDEPGMIVHRGVDNNSPELAALYRRADVFVLPTRADCYSLVAMEALASGLPVVISNIGGIGDIVDHGETGFLTEPYEYGPVCAALDDLVDNPILRARMSAAARAAAVARFDCRANIGRILAQMRTGAEEPQEQQEKQGHEHE